MRRLRLGPLQRVRAAAQARAQAVRGLALLGEAPRRRERLLPTAIPACGCARPGFNGWSWGENIGCGWGTTTKDVYAAVLASHRAMQAEKSSNGGHWKNIKNPRYNLIGIGVWKYGSRVRVVTDFYHAG